MKMMSPALAAALAATLLLAACQAQPRPGPAGETRSAGDQAVELPDGRRYRVDRESSEVRIVVYPAGSLARFGHPHVIGGAVIDGEVMLAENFADSGLRLRIDLDALELDRAEWREDEGFDPEMSESAIQGTRDNLRSNQVLDVANHPEIIIESLGITGPRWQPDIELRIRLRGKSRELTVPVALQIDDQQLVAIGQIALRQSDFGIQPFSAAGGNLQVADEILIRFRIAASP
jgi:polyisoprenoid-binding protein YceI